jgi:hypothetical protein
MTSEVHNPTLVKVGDVAWVNFDMLYPDGKVSSEVRETWNAWFRHHTIDPAMVLIEGTLVVDFDHYRISYPSYDPDAEEWITLQRTLQLEARPSEPPCF